MGDLTEQMKKRLEEWRKNTLPKKLEAFKRDPKPGPFFSRKDYGDDIEFMRIKDDNR